MIIKPMHNPIQIPARPRRTGKHSKYPKGSPIKPISDENLRASVCGIASTASRRPVRPFAADRVNSVRKLAPPSKSVCTNSNHRPDRGKQSVAICFESVTNTSRYRS